MGILKKIGNATIVKESLRLAKLATAHPYFTYFLYTGIFVAVAAYAYHEGHDWGYMHGKYDEAKNSADRASEQFRTGYDMGHDWGVTYGRFLEKHGIPEE